MSRAYVQKLRSDLQRVETAINEVLEAGQSMSLDDGVSYTRASLPQLRLMRKELLNHLSRANGSNPMFQPVKMGGMYNG